MIALEAAVIRGTIRRLHGNHIAWYNEDNATILLGLGGCLKILSFLLIFCTYRQRMDIDARVSILPTHSLSMPSPDIIGKGGVYLHAPDVSYEESTLCKR